MLLQSAGVGLNALQDASMEGMQKIAVAQEEAHHFCTPLENTAGLRVGAESEAADGFENSRASFAADLGAGIQHARDRSDANRRSLRYVANGGPSWNRFHAKWAFFSLRVIRLRPRKLPTSYAVSLAYQRNTGALNELADLASTSEP